MKVSKEWCERQPWNSIHTEQVENRKKYLKDEVTTDVNEVWKSTDFTQVFVVLMVCMTCEYKARDKHYNNKKKTNLYYEAIINFNKLRETEILQRWVVLGFI